MTYFAYYRAVCNSIVNLLKTAGYVNGDNLGQEAVLPKKTYFFKDFNEKEKFKNKTYLVWNVVENANNQYADNSKIGGNEFGGIAIVTPNSIDSKEVKTIADSVEQAIENAGWRINSVTPDRDWESGLNTVTFSISKVFQK